MMFRSWKVWNSLRPVRLAAISCVIGIGLLHVSGSAVAQEGDCDRLAASPFDKSRPVGVAGVAIDAIDPVKAVPACEAALTATTALPRIKYQLARALQKSGTRADRMVQITREAAEAGFAPAMHNYAAQLFNGTGGPKDERAAIAWFGKAAVAGFALSMRQLGLLYVTGQGLEPDAALAAEWFLKGAEAGDSTSAFHHAGSLEAGIVFPKDERQAAEWYLRAGDGGVAAAWYRLGLMFSDGRGVAKNPAEANVLFRRAADAGDTNAMYVLAMNLKDGAGVKQNLGESLTWFEKAAAAGSAASMLELGKMYQYGIGGPSNEASAIDWYKKATDAGDPKAKSLLAVLLDRKTCFAPTTTPQTVAACDAILASPQLSDNDRLSALRFRATAQLELGLYPQALADIDAALRLKPNDVKLFNLRSVANELSGRLDAAVIDATRAIQIDPGLASSYLRRGSVFYRQKQFKAAIDDFSECIKRGGDELCYEARGNAYTDNNQAPLGVADLSEAIRLRPSSARFLGSRGLAHAVAGDIRAAELDFRRALALDPKDQQAIKGLKLLEDRGLVSTSTSTSTSASNAEIVTCSDLAKTWNDRKNACQAVVDNKDAPPKARAFAYSERGRVSNLEGRLDSAIADLTSAIELEGQAIDYNYRADLYRRVRNYSAALTDATKAITLKSDEWYYYYTRAMINLDRKDDWRVVADLSKAIELNPKSVDALNERGGAYYRLRHIAKARADLWTSNSIKPTYAAYVYIAMIASDDNDRNLAIHNYGLAIQIDPKGYQAYAGRGREYNKLLKGDEALRDLNKAIELEPNDGGNYASRAAAWMIKKQNNQAVTDATKAIALAPDVADYFSIRGAAYFGLGQRNLAIADWRRALALDPDSDTAKHNLKLAGQKP